MKAHYTTENTESLVVVIDVWHTKHQNIKIEVDREPSDFFFFLADHNHLNYNNRAGIANCALLHYSLLN